MDNPSVIFAVVFAALFCVGPFLIYIFVMFSVRDRIGNWYMGKMKALNEKDLSVFAVRNMLYPGLIFVLFLLPIIAYIVFRPAFFDPSWLCILFAGTFVAIVLFQVFQYIWLYYRTKNHRKR